MEESFEFTVAEYTILSVKHSPSTGQLGGNQFGGGWLAGKFNLEFLALRRDSYDLQLQLLVETILGCRTFLLWAAMCALMFLVVQ